MNNKRLIETWKITMLLILIKLKHEEGNYLGQ